MKVFSATPGIDAGPWYFLLRPEPAFHTFSIASAEFRIFEPDDHDATVLVLTSLPQLTIQEEKKTIVVTLVPDDTALLTPRRDHPFKLTYVDDEGRTWVPEGDGTGVVKARAA